MGRGVELGLGIVVGKQCFGVWALVCLVTLWAGRRVRVLGLWDVLGGLGLNPNAAPETVPSKPPNPKLLS